MRKMRGVSGAAAMAQEHRHSERVLRGQESEQKAPQREEDGMDVIVGKRALKRPL